MDKFEVRMIYVRSKDSLVGKPEFALNKMPSAWADGMRSGATGEPGQRFFLNLYSTPTEMAKLTSNWLTLGA
jgi:hypothetical protein